MTGRSDREIFWPAGPAVRRFIPLSLLFSVPLMLLLSTAHLPAAETADPYEILLQKQGIEPDFAGIQRYLRLLTPTDEQKREAAVLVRTLGADEFAVREKATRELQAMPHPPVEELRAATESNDAEIRWRANVILKSHKQRDTPLLQAVMAVIARKKLPGLTAEVLTAYPHLERPFGTRLGTRALRATVVKADGQRLRESLEKSDGVTQAAVIDALFHLEGNGAFKVLLPVLQDAKRPEDARLAAATAFAEAGRRESLPALIVLLDSPEINIRTRSGILLRSLTGKRFGFTSYDTPERRTVARKQWTGWLATDGKTAALKHPLNTHETTESYLNGHTLLACGYKKKVIELDAAGKEVWSFDVDGPYGAEKLANGNVLITSYGPNEIIEVSPDKKIVWRMKVPSCLNARPLPNGNILIACHTAKQVWEVTRDKRTVWKYTSTENCYDAHRLPNGHTMISSDKGIIEVTPEGKTVWELNDKKRYYGFQPLPNGNLLLASYSGGEVKEITRDKKPVWSFKESSAFDAFRLPNGNTLITSTSRFVEVDPKGKTVWTHTGNQHGRARR